MAVRHRLGRLRERQQRVAATVGGGARVRRDPASVHAQRPGRLALDDHALLAVRAGLAGLEAEAGVELREEVGVLEPAHAPPLVGDEQQRELGERIAARGEGVQHADRQHDAALHIDRARPDQAVAVADQRAMRVVADDRVEVAQEQDASGPLSVDSRQEVRRVAGRRARDALDLGFRRQQCRAQRDRLLGAVVVARRRGHADERLELAHRPPRDVSRLCLDPCVHRKAVSGLGRRLCRVLQAPRTVSRRSSSAAEIVSRTGPAAKRSTSACRKPSITSRVACSRRRPRDIR